MSRFKNFRELSWKEQVLFSEALFFQFSVGLLLKIIPFRWIPRLFPSKVQVTGFKVQGTRNLEPGTWNPEPETLTLIKVATQRASKISPWKNKCLVQSLAARRILNRRKIQSQLSLGVAKGANGKMIAHAWLKVGDLEIVEKGLDFSELYLF